MASPGLHALLIGVDFYQTNVTPQGSYHSLGGCVADIRQIEEFLRKRLSLADDNLIKLTATDDGSGTAPESVQLQPTYGNMVAAFQRIGRKATKGDHVYIHYAGHGGRVRPTLLPAIKGSSGFDEALVPTDIGTNTARYLRDVELSKLLQDLVDRELIVTVVFDCCHSGGALRSVGAVARGVDFIDDRPMTHESAVATKEALEAHWRRAVGGEATRSLTNAEKRPGYTLLAACRPSEKANEFAFDGIQRNGALSYWLLEALRSLGTEQSFKQLYDRILAQVHSKFPSQTPVLIGDPGRLIFDGRQIKPTYATLIAVVGPAPGKITLATGLAAGVSDGAEFAVYDRLATDIANPAGRKAIVRLTVVGDATSEADIVETFGSNAIVAGDQAALLAAAVTLRRRVKFVDHHDQPIDNNDPTFQPLRQALPGNGWVVEATPNEPAEFGVRLNDADTHFEICSADGIAYKLRPVLPKNADPAVLVRRLVHLAKYRAWSELENKAPNARLQARLGVEVLALPQDFDPNRLPWPTPTPFTDPTPEVKVGDWLALKISNGSLTTTNIAVLDLQPDWGISRVYPANSEFEELDPIGNGGGPLIIPLRADLPVGYDEGTDTIKVIATLHPVLLQAAELPALDETPQPRMATRSAVSDPLGQLLAAFAAPTAPTRAVVAYATPGKEWAARQCSIRIRR